MAACIQPIQPIIDNTIGLLKIRNNTQFIPRLSNDMSHTRTGSINRRVVNQRRTNRRGKNDRRSSNAVVQLVSGSQMDQCLLSTVGNWNFNVFNLDKLTNALIENSYHDTNPYHNAMHAADVAQAMHCFLSEPKLLKHLTPLEKLVSILGAITHDVDHPGVNQAYLIATMNPLANLYNKVSILENHHWRVAVGFLSESGIFNHFERDTWESIIWQIKSLILATDITRQKEFLTKLKTHNDEGTLDLSVTENRHFILQIALKCADICNPCRPWEISRRWSNTVCEEFFMQGEQESRLKLPVTPLCDRHCTTVAKIQTGFMQFVVRPLFEQWSRFCDSKQSRVLLKNVDNNKMKWDEEIVAATLASDDSSEEEIQTSIPVTSPVVIKEGDILIPEAERLSPLNEEQSDDSAGNAKMIYASDSSCLSDDDRNIDADADADRPPPVHRPLNFARRHSMPTQIVARHCPRRSNSTTSRRHSLPHEDLDETSASRFDLLCNKLSAVLERLSTSGSNNVLTGSEAITETTLSGTLVSLSTRTDCLEIANFRRESDIQMDAHGLSRPIIKSRHSKHAASDPYINKTNRGRQLPSLVETIDRTRNNSTKLRFCSSAEMSPSTTS